jgi:hypothetical protein
MMQRKFRATRNFPLSARLPQLFKIGSYQEAVLASVF